MEKTRQYHRGRQFNDFRQSIGMPWPILSKQSGIPEAELLILKEQEQIDDEQYASIAAGLGTDLETLKSYRPTGYSITNNVEEAKDQAQVIGVQEFKDNAQSVTHADGDLTKELLAKLEAKHEALHESERARIKLLEEKIALLEERNALQEEVIRMLRSGGK